MSKDKYPSTFSPQMEAIVFIMLQIFFATRAVLEIGEYLTIILRNRAEYCLILSRRGARLVLTRHVTEYSPVFKTAHVTKNI